jgi:hypothetical protein
MADKDIALAIIQAAVAIAGLVLVYSAFLVAKASSYNSKRADKFLTLARLALVPVISALFCSGLGVRVLLAGHWGQHWASSWLLFGFEIVLALTAVYAIIAAFMGT